ncbi:hypothetical protein Dda_9432 [Drechslerella dactyloides]|uniref:Uncharacterized protein n=1 Tax=Drechslerella dactyloides TaxID=74499 RepID=A0AAD6ISY2_DREDA|nr:hypothetical protein Dda_9432 [Drechslerella dactyloides]
MKVIGLNAAPGRNSPCCKNPENRDIPTKLMLTNSLVLPVPRETFGLRKPITKLRPPPMADSTFRRCKNLSV